MVTLARTDLDICADLVREAHTLQFSPDQVANGLTRPPILISGGVGRGRDFVIETTHDGYRQYSAYIRFVIQGRPVLTAICRGGADPRLDLEEVKRVYAYQMSVVCSHAEVARLPLGACTVVTHCFKGMNFLGTPWGVNPLNFKWLEFVLAEKGKSEGALLSPQEYLASRLNWRDWNGMLAYLEMSFVQINPVREIFAYEPGSGWDD